MKKCMQALCLATVMLLSVVLPAGSSAEAATVFQDDFEGSLHGSWLLDMADSQYSGKISNNYAASGASSFRFELNKSDPIVNGSKRAEIALTNDDGPLDEHTYNFATFLPDGGDEDFALDPEGSEIIAQWHNTPDPGEEWTCPPLALHTYKGEYYLSRSWDDAAITSDDQMDEKGNHAKHDLGSYLEDKGRWVQWSFKIKWGWLDSHNPRIQVFKDGEQIIDIIGPNTTNDQNATYMKLGIYKWDWTQGKRDTSIVSQRVIYFDNVSVN